MLVKAGGFNSGTTTLNQFVTTEKETIDAYEVGLKKTFGGRLQINASAFLYNYKDIQVPVSFFNTIVSANQTQFVNLPKARNYGLEIETTWQPIDNLQILANYSYLNAKVRDGCCFQDPDDPRGQVAGAQVVPGQTTTGALNQDLKGQTLPSSTPHRFTINGNYTWELEPGNLSASLTYVWRDSTYYSVFNRYYNEAKSFGQTDARLVYRDKDDKYTVIGYLKNVFDTRGSAGVSGNRISSLTASQPNAGFVTQTVSYVLPRTYGVEIQFRY